MRDLNLSLSLLSFFNTGVRNLSEYLLKLHESFCQPHVLSHTDLKQELTPSPDWAICCLVHWLSFSSSTWIHPSVAQPHSRSLCPCLANMWGRSRLGCSYRSRVSEHLSILFCSRRKEIYVILSFLGRLGCVIMWSAARNGHFKSKHTWWRANSVVSPVPNMQSSALKIHVGGTWLVLCTEGKRHTEPEVQLHHREFRKQHLTTDKS